MTLSEEYSRRDALGLAELVSSGETTPAELAEEAIRRIEELNPRLNAVVIKLYELGREMATSQLPDGRFRGVPFLMKDLVIQWEGVPLTSACRYFKDYVATEDSAVASRARQAGFVLLGKTNVPENGYNASTEPALYGPTHNPWSNGVVPGGSSGGSAAAVASGMVPLASANDGGGSIRIPASNNGLVGLKVSRGRCTWGPQYTDIWYGAAVDLCVSRTVRDTAAYLDAVGGPLPGEPYGLAMPERPYVEELGTPVGQLRIGVVTKEPSGEPLHPEAAAAMANAARLCEGLGHNVEEIDDLRYELPVDQAVRMTATLSSSAFQASEALVGRPVTEADVEPVTWSIIQLGRSISGIQHADDIETLRKFGRGIVEGLAQYDVTITPTQAKPPPPLGWYDMSMTDFDAYNERLWPSMTFTIPFNLSGQPALTLPLHWTTDELPLGVQLAGRIGDEVTLLRLATQLEDAQPWFDHRPPVSL